MLTWTVRQDSSDRWTGQIVDLSGNGVPNTSLITGTLSLYDVDSGTTINAWNDTDILANAAVTIDGSGNITWNREAEDNPLLSDRRDVEKHYAEFRFTWADGALTHRVCFAVARNIRPD
jgi:hypothetical protein